MVSAAGAELARELGQLPERQQAGVWGTYIVESGSIPGLKYKVLAGPTGYGCTCPSFEYRRRCPHVDQVRKEIEPMTTQALMRITPPTATLPTKAEMESMTAIAAQLITAGRVALPENLKNEGEVTAVILAGWELGVKPMSALRHISVINGKTEPDGQLMAAICAARERTISFVVTVDTDDATEVELRRPSHDLIVRFRYTQADAERSGRAKKPGPWQTDPRTMRRWKCYKELARSYCGDLINGVELAGDFVPELGRTDPADDDEGGTFIDVTATVVQEPQDGPVAPDGLYNEGDEPEPAVDLATREQLASIEEWRTAVLEKRDRQGVGLVVKLIKDSFGYAVENEKLQPSKMRAADAAIYIGALRTMHETGKLPEQAQAFR